MSKETQSAVSVSEPAHNKQFIGRVIALVRQVIGSREAGIALVLLLAGAYLSFSTTTFLTVGNLSILARQISLTAIIAVGMTMVILLGDIDLSVGSVVALATVVTGFLIVKAGVPYPVGILAGLLVGVLIGLLNGMLVIKTGVPSFIVTLGMMGVARGFALVITKGSSISGLPSAYLTLGQGYWLGIPIPVIILIVIAITAHIFLSRMKTGRHIYFTGSNSEAALLSGINVNKIKILVFTLCSTLAAIEAVIETSRMNAAQPAAGVGYELTAIGAVIIGGASLFGGEGSILGTLLGATLLGLITNGLILLGVSAYWQQVFSGSIIILAVTMDMWRQRRR
ncbi:MAG: ABC transporter permease [Anaerolineales bacterium]|nr:ABC transporter permease [Anaerolineales bacterium]